MEQAIQPGKLPAAGTGSLWREGQARVFLGMLLLALSWAMWARAADPARIRGYVYETEPGVVVLESDNGILYTLKGRGLDAFLETTVDAVGDVSADPGGEVSLSVRSMKPAQGDLEFSPEDEPVRK